MLAKLEHLSERLTEIDELLMQPEVVSDQENYRRLNREHAELAPVVALYKDFSQVQQDVETAREMLSDPEMKEFAQQEINEAEEKLAGIENDLQVMLLPKDPNDGKNIFLEIRAGTGGDESALFAGDLLRILERLYTAFPGLERVTSYAGPKTVLHKTPEELAALRQAGLYRLYLGVETGSDALLKAVNKGVTAEEMLEAGRRIVTAGFDLWVMVILGLAGPGEASREHILSTAAMINAMKPRHLSALTFMAKPGTPMGEAAARGAFTMLTPAELLEETKLLLEHLNVEPLHFTSDHASNYLPLKGGLPEDRERLLSLLEGALSGRVGIRPEYRRGL